MKLQHKENYSGVYGIIDNKNRLYVGSSISMYYRLRRHLSDLRKNRHKNPILQNSFNKYGEDSFEACIIDISKDKLEYLEKYYIDILKPYYNVQKDPIRQPKTIQMKRKISNSLKEGYKNGSIKPTRCKEVVVYNKDAKAVGVYNTVKECVEKLGLSRTRVDAVLNKEQLHTKGYQIFFLEEEHDVQKLDLKIGNSGYLESNIKDRYIARVKSR